MQLRRTLMKSSFGSLLLTVCNSGGAKHKWNWGNEFLFGWPSFAKRTSEKWLYQRSLEMEKTMEMNIELMFRRNCC